MKNEKTIRTLKVLFILSFILDLTIIGLIAGAPIFLALWGLQYIFLGKANPFYVFTTNKKLSKMFKDDEVIKNRVKEIYKNQFGYMQIEYASLIDFLTDRMEKYYKFFISHIEKEMNKYGLKFDGDGISSVILLIDCEVVILASTDLMVENMGYLQKEQLFDVLPKESLIDFFAKNKDNITFSLADDRYTSAASMLQLVEICVKKYKKEVDEIAEAIKNLDVEEYEKSRREIFDKIDEKNKQATEEKVLQELIDAVNEELNKDK